MLQQERPSAGPRLRVPGAAPSARWGTAACCDFAAVPALACRGRV